MRRKISFIEDLSGGAEYGLDRFVHAVEERYAPEANFDAALAHEHAISRSLDGRTVFDKKPRKWQLPLFE